VALTFNQFTRFLGLHSFLSYNSRNPNNSRNTMNSKNSINSINAKILLLFTVYCLLFTVFGGCASFHRENILAVVDGEPITEGDMKYSLQITHRREDLSSAGVMSLSKYVQKLIDDRLIIQEARRMGMDQYPEVIQDVQAYILRESVVRLHDDEIVKKVSISENDIVNYYKKNYERFTLGLIEVGSEKDAKDILEQLKKGEDFKELVQKYSTHISKKNGGEVVLKRNSMATYIDEAVLNLRPGEFSGVIKIANKFYIVKLIDRKEAPDKELEKVRGRIERAIRKQKEEERSDEYLKYLREHANINIDQKLLSSIKEDMTDEGIKKLLNDTRPLAEVNGTVLPVSDFVKTITHSTRKSSEDILNNWIDRKVVDHEALRRHYENNADLRKMIHRYENQLLLRTFIKNIIVPRITISDKTLKEYYDEHKQNFVYPARFRIQQITLKNMDEAKDALDNLKNGADFSWEAKRKSTDSAAPKGGDRGWLTVAELPEPLREIIFNLKPGDISSVIKIDSRYMIVRLIGKTDEEVEEFNKVKNDVYRACYAEQINNLYNEYVNRLKKEAMIEIYEDEIRSLEEKL
jgi:parvulin-like peptidyl-prolyl isomerase